jgi:hypothetical protein
MYGGKGTVGNNLYEGCWGVLGGQFPLDSSEIVVNINGLERGSFQLRPTGVESCPIEAGPVPLYRYTNSEEFYRCPKKKKR